MTLTTGNWQQAQASGTNKLVGLALYAAAAGANAPPPTVRSCVVEALGYLRPSYIQSGGWWAPIIIIIIIPDRSPCLALLHRHARRVKPPLTYKVPPVPLPTQYRRPKSNHMVSHALYAAPLTPQPSRLGSQEPAQPQLSQLLRTW
jgi:hypothetical protein